MYNKYISAYYMNLIGCCKTFLLINKVYSYEHGKCISKLEITSPLKGCG